MTFAANTSRTSAPKSSAAQSAEPRWIDASEEIAPSFVPVLIVTGMLQDCPGARIRPWRSAGGTVQLQDAVTCIMRTALFDSFDNLKVNVSSSPCLTVPKSCVGGLSTKSLLGAERVAVEEPCETINKLKAPRQVPVATRVNVQD